MVTVENALKALSWEDYDMSTLKKGIREGALVKVAYDSTFSSYDYAITRDSLYGFLVELKFPEHKIEKTMENV